MRGLVLLSLFCVCYSAPMLSTAETLDVDTNAQIDHIRLVFDADMDDNSFVLSEWTVGTYHVEAVITCLLPFSACGANDTEVYLRLTESGTPDTGALPTVAYAGPSTKDILAQSLAPMNAPTVDRAPPVVVMAEGAVGSRAVRIVMSEPVMSTRPGGGFNYTDFQYQNRPANGTMATGLPATGPITYQGAEEFVPAASDLDGSDGVLVINADQPLLVTDFDWDSVSARNYRVLDLAGVTAAMNGKLVQQNSILDQPAASSTYSGYTLALGIVLLVLFLLFIFGSLAWWWSKRSEASSVAPDTDGGAGSVPDRSHGTPAGTAKSPESNTIELANKGAAALLPGMTSKDAMNKYDENHDGVIDKQELGHMIHDARTMHGQPDPVDTAPAAVMPMSGGGAPDSDVADRNKQMLRDDDDTKPPDDGVSDIKFDL